MKSVVVNETWRKIAAMARHASLPNQLSVYERAPGGPVRIIFLQKIQFPFFSLLSFLAVLFRVFNQNLLGKKSHVLNHSPIHTIVSTHKITFWLGCILQWQKQTVRCSLVFYFFDKPSTALEFTSLERPFGTKVKRTVSLDIERDSGTLFAITRK